jgi:hypothetical protein
MDSKRQSKIAYAKSQVDIWTIQYIAQDNLRQAVLLRMNEAWQETKRNLRHWEKEVEILTELSKRKK